MDAAAITFNKNTIVYDEKTAFENIIGKGENAGNQHFLIFPYVFYHLKDTFLHKLLTL